MRGKDHTQPCPWRWAYIERCTAASVSASAGDSHCPVNVVHRTDLSPPFYVLLHQSQLPSAISVPISATSSLESHHSVLSHSALLYRSHTTMNPAQKAVSSNKVAVSATVVTVEQLPPA